MTCNGLVWMSIDNCSNTYIGVHLQDYEWIAQVLATSFFTYGHTGWISVRNVIVEGQAATHSWRSCGDFTSTLHLVVANDALTSHYRNAPWKDRCPDA